MLEGVGGGRRQPSTLIEKSVRNRTDGIMSERVLGSPAAQPTGLGRVVSPARAPHVEEEAQIGRMDPGWNVGPEPPKVVHRGTKAAPRKEGDGPVVEAAAQVDLRGNLSLRMMAE